MARTVRTKVYKFNELSDKAKEKAIEDYRYGNTEIFWADENRASMESFAEIFPINVTNWSYGGRGEGVSFNFTCDDAIEELSGQRLATYIWNNYRSEIYSRKYYSGLNSLTKDRLVHPCVKSERIKTGPNSGLYGNYYHSIVQMEKYNCPLTGYCMDNELLDEIWKFLDKPDKRDFKELLNDCFYSWIKACNEEIEYQNSDEYIIENIKANEYEFTADGSRF